MNIFVEIFALFSGQTLNDNRLLEFRLSREAEQPAVGGLQELRVRSATLWLRADLRSAPHSSSRGPHRTHHSQAACQPTLWVFAVSGDMDEDITRLGPKV